MAFCLTSKCPVTPGVFTAIQNVDVSALETFSEKQLRPIIPSLVRMSLCSPVDNTPKWNLKRKLILKTLTGIRAVNNLVSLLSIDFRELEQDVSKEKRLVESLGGSVREGLGSKSARSPALEFERSEAPQKLRLLVSEMLFVAARIRVQAESFYERSSELFDSEIYLEEISDILCIVRAELPNLFSITDMSEVLLHVSNGAWLLCRLIANNPDSFLEVCMQLVVTGPKSADDSLDVRRRSQALTMLCDMCPLYLLVVRSMCIEHCRLPGLALTLTLTHCDREERANVSDSIGRAVVFVTSLLLDHDVAVRTWFAQFVRAGDQRRDSRPFWIVRERLLAELKGDLRDLGDESKIVKACMFIRLYSALRCVAGVKLSDEEGAALLRLVTLRPPPVGSGVRFVTLGLCFVLACPQLVASDQQEGEVIAWLDWLVRNGELHEQEAGDGSSFSEMLLLVAIHFHGSQSSAISDLVGAALGMKVHIKLSALTKLKNIFTLRVFTEQVVAALAVKVPVTANLNGKMKGFLPIHCIHSLLKTRTFSKHRVSVRDWICCQLNECTLPIHPVLPQLLEVFINSILLPHAKIERSNEPIPEADVSATFDSLLDRNDDRSLATKLLYLLYVLYYQDVLLSNMAAIASSRRRVLHYSQSFIDQLPVRHLLQLAQARSSELAGMYSTLLSLVATHHHHLCLVNDWLDCHELSSRCESREISDSLSELSVSCSPESLAEAIRLLPTNGSLCAVLMEKISARPSEDLLPYCNVLIENLLVFLEDSIPRRCQDLVLVIWNKVNVVSPNLKLSTINALRPRSVSGLHSLEEVTRDPLTVLRCDPRVFKCPPFVEITLSTLSCFLQMSKSFLSNSMVVGPAATQSPSATNDQEELRISLVATQESAAIQILLECCLPQEDDGDGPLMSNLREVQCLIFTHVHQRFIADPSLAKLIHFQGYPMQLVPAAVAGIPSMHICLDFLPELISQPQHAKLCFAIRLTSYLSLRYAITKTMAVAKLCINVMATLLPVFLGPRRASFFHIVLPDLVRFCTAFPVLCDDAISLLFQLARVLRSEVADGVVRPGPTEGRSLADEDGIFEFAEGDELAPEATPASVLRRIDETITLITSSTSLLKVKLVV